MSDLFSTKDLLNSLDKLSPEQRALLLSRLIDEDAKQEEIESNLRQSEENKPPVCDKCGCINAIKFGKKNGRQRYRCKECGATFMLTNNTIFQYSHLDVNQWETIIRGMVLNLSLSKIADETGLSKKTVWYNEKKIMQLLMNMFGDQDTFVDIAECDEKEVHLSYKGKRDPEFFLKTLGRMPRHHRSREEKLTYLKRFGLLDDLEKDPEKLDQILHGNNYLPGTKNDSVCILSGRDRSGNLYFRATCVGKLESIHVINQFEDRFAPDAILVTDSSQTYDLFAELANIYHIKIESGKHNNGPYNLARINADHSEMDKYWSASRENLPATKYLDLGLIMFWWLMKHKHLTIQEQVNELLGYIYDNPISCDYEEIRHRPLTLDTKGLIPREL